MNLSIDPGNPSMICVWRRGKPVAFVRVAAVDFNTRIGRTLGFAWELDRKIRAIEAQFPDNPIKEVAIEFMGPSAPKDRKQGVIALGISTGQIQGYFTGRGIKTRWIETGRDCKVAAVTVCNRLKIDVMTKAGNVNSHKADSVLIGFLAKYDEATW